MLYYCKALVQIVCSAQILKLNRNNSHQTERPSTIVLQMGQFILNIRINSLQGQEWRISTSTSHLIEAANYIAAKIDYNNYFMNFEFQQP